ncbi:E3 ubiquitin-protein ligase TRIM71-like, partial [Stylophora pistillata]|uniref:E3 ubiquitin-protein ligase TRIM71-like n=1 Tax=Stylophora pistillata TaxID=50429 RepID=UPI000C0413B8
MPKRQIPCSGNLKDLPTTFRINSLLDVLAIKECHTTGVKCASERKLQVQSLIESQKEKIKQKRNEIVELEILCNHIEPQADTVKQDIHKFAENMIAAIEKKRKEMMIKVELQQKESFACVRTPVYEVKRQVKLLETAVEKAETLLKRCTSTELTQSMKTILPEEVSDDEKQSSSDIEGLRQFRFKGNKTLLDSLNSDSIGSFVTFVNKTLAHQSTAEGKGISSSVGILNGPFRVAVNERDEIAVTYAGDYRVQGDKQGEIDYPAGLAHDRNKNTAVVDTTNKRIQLFNEQVNKAGHVMVCDKNNHRVQVFEMSSKFVTKFGKEGSELGEFRMPTSTAA